MVYTYKNWFNHNEASNLFIIIRLPVQMGLIL
jgi:hypothetical protein